MLDAFGAKDLIQVIAAERAESILSTTISSCSGCRVEISSLASGGIRFPRVDECKCFVAVRNVSVSLTELHLAEHHRQPDCASGLERGSGALRSTLRIGLVTNANLKGQNKKGGI